MLVELDLELVLVLWIVVLWLALVSNHHIVSELQSINVIQQSALVLLALVRLTQSVVHGCLEGTVTTWAVLMVDAVGVGS